MRASKEGQSSVGNCRKGANWINPGARDAGSRGVEGSGPLHVGCAVPCFGRLRAGRGPRAQLLRRVRKVLDVLIGGVSAVTSFEVTPNVAGLCRLALLVFRELDRSS